MTFEYKVVPAPTRGRKARGVKTPADRFARALEEVMNDLAEDGWEYFRTDTLPAEERQGLAGRTTVYQNMLVFRRAVSTGDDAGRQTPDHVVEPAPPRKVAPAPAPAAEAPAPAPEAPPSNTLDAMVARELAAARAPRLPSADAAQAMPAGAGLSRLAALRRDMAAE